MLLKQSLLAICLLFIGLTTLIASPKKPSIYDIDVITIDGKKQSLSTYKNKVMLIVNTASSGQYSSQYKQLEMLYRQYKNHDFVILAFPCNDFGYQEPGSNSEIKKFCKTTYKLSFPLFAKIHIRGEKSHALYRYLTEKEKNGRYSTPVSWNFNKFIVNQNGELIAYFDSFVLPLDDRIKEVIHKSLALKKGVRQERKNKVEEND